MKKHWKKIIISLSAVVVTTIVAISVYSIVKNPSSDISTEHEVNEELEYSLRFPYAKTIEMISLQTQKKAEEEARIAEEQKLEAERLADEKKKAEERNYTDDELLIVWRFGFKGGDYQFTDADQKRYEELGAEYEANVSSMTQKFLEQYLNNTLNLQDLSSYEYSLFSEAYFAWLHTFNLATQEELLWEHISRHDRFESELQEEYYAVRGQLRYPSEDEVDPTPSDYVDYGYTEDGISGAHMCDESGNCWDLNTGDLGYICERSPAYGQ